MSILTFTRLTDCSNGFRAMKSDGLSKLMLKEEQYYSPELLIEAARSGLVIKEVPVTVHERTHGVSKKGRDIMYGVKFGRIFTIPGLMETSARKATNKNIKKKVPLLIFFFPKRIKTKKNNKIDNKIPNNLNGLIILFPMTRIH